MFFLLKRHTPQKSAIASRSTKQQAATIIQTPPDTARFLRLSAFIELAAKLELAPAAVLEGHWRAVMALE